MIPLPGSNDQLLLQLPPAQPGNVCVKVIIHLYKVPVTFSPDLNLGSFIESTFPGYAHSGAINSIITDDGIDGVNWDCGMTTFTCTGPVLPPEPCYGYYLEDGFSGGVLAGFQAFDQPFYWNANGDTLTLRIINKIFTVMGVPIVTPFHA